MADKDTHMITSFNVHVLRDPSNKIVCAFESEADCWKYGLEKIEEDNRGIWSSSSILFRSDIDKYFYCLSHGYSVTAIAISMVDKVK